MMRTSSAPEVGQSQVPPPNHSASGSRVQPHLVSRRQVVPQPPDADRI
ncbi:nucleotide binding protein 1, isoform CRA_b [Rattus norvegicus]|uniref:Nucleotide binding protein 1, isoform CRA_b n=1 Tax=Rattus norvegicus TaxID=10116 RepID=A6K4K1_RAT|nr:nucleotide binding protein 1, isoform CRA_b [Rattus norvegicus]